MELVAMDRVVQSAFLAEASILLILLAGAILLYWSFREKYLVPWIAGWTAYSLAKFLCALGEPPAASRLWLPLAYAAFLLGVGLFTWAVFLYIQQKKLLWHAAAILSFAFVLGLISLRVPQSLLVRRVFD